VVKEHKAERHASGFSSWTQIITNHRSESEWESRLCKPRLERALPCERVKAISGERLLVDLSFQFRHPAFAPALLPITGKCVARSLAELPAPSVQHVRVHFQPARYDL
jgi:hypothetical protein